MSENENWRFLHPNNVFLYFKNSPVWSVSTLRFLIGAIWVVFSPELSVSPLTLLCMYWGVNWAHFLLYRDVCVWWPGKLGNSDKFLAVSRHDHELWQQAVPVQLFQLFQSKFLIGVMMVILTPLGWHLGNCQLIQVPISSPIHLSLSIKL